MKDRFRPLAMGLALLLLAAPVSALATVGEGGAADAPIDAPTAEPTAGATEAARLIRRELRDLARAWEEGGGRFGYPFWEKAGRRWDANQITTTMYREYVTGYRDRLRAGCELIDAADIDTSEAKDVRSLALDACRARVDALRNQQRWLDDLIRRDGIAGDSDEDSAALDERIAERQREWQEALQQSYRSARRALDTAQQQLDDRGLERLPEDAFL